MMNKLLILLVFLAVPLQVYAAPNDLPDGVPFIDRAEFETDQARQDDLISSNTEAITNISNQPTVDIDQLEADQQRQDDGIAANRKDIDSLSDTLANWPEAPTGTNSGVFESALQDIRSDVSDLNAAMAGAFAASSHHFDTKGGLQVGLAVGNYKSYEAGSIAIGGAISDTAFINGNVTFDSNGNKGYGAGVTLSLE